MVYFTDPQKLQKLLAVLTDGMGTTLSIFFWTLLFSLPLGLLVALGRMSRRRVLSGPVAFYILVMRGTPLMLQIITVHFILPGLLGVNIDRFVSTIVAFSLNYAAYFAEIYRGGIQSIPQGQYEAGKVLGFTRAQTFLRIILPQAVKRILQPVSNEVITLVKDTSLARVIGIGEVIRAAQDITAQRALLWPLFYTGVFYLVFNGGLTLLFGWAEKKLNYYKG